MPSSTVALVQQEASCQLSSNVLVAFLQFPINILRACTLLYVYIHFLQFSSTPADLPIGITIIVATLKEEICGEGELGESRLRHLGPSRNRGRGSTNWSNLQKPPLMQRRELICWKFPSSHLLSSLFCYVAWYQL